MSETAPHPPPLLAAARLAFALQVLLLVAALAVAAGVVGHGLSHRQDAWREVQRDAEVELDRVADRLVDHFDDLRSTLLALTVDQRVRSFDPAARSHIQTVFEHERQRLKLSELYIVSASFTGDQRPDMSFEFGERGLPEAEVHSPARERAENDVLQEAIRRYRADPALGPLLSRELPLCIPDERGGQAAGFVYTLPIRSGPELVGVAAAMVPSRFLAELFAPGPSFATVELVDRDHGDVPLAATAGDLAAAILARDVEPVPGRHFRLRATVVPERLLEHHGGVLGSWVVALLVVVVGGAAAAVVGLVRRRADERLRHLAERHRLDAMMRAIVEGTAAAVGEAYLESLVRHLAATFETRMALVAELVGDGERRARTVAVWNGVEVAPNFTYDLVGTPCEEVVGGGPCVFPRAVQQLFPDDRLLAELGVVSYLGVPVPGADGAPLGLLAALGTEPLAAMPVGADAVLSVLASRAGAELERLRADRSRHRSEALSASIVETIGHGIMVLDGELRPVLFNRAMEELSGLRRDEAIARGATLWELFPHLVASAGEGDLRRALAGEEVWRERRPFTLPNGRSGFSSEVYHPLRDDRGEVTGVVCVVRDVTREIEVEDRLQQAQRLEAIGTLAGGIAHDFNNILQVILGFAEMAGHEVEEGHPVHDSLAEIVTAGRRGARLARQILESSRTQEEDRSALKLAPLVKETLVLLRSSLPSSIVIEQRVDPDCGPVLAHPAEIHRVIMNLASNAYQAMRAEGGTLTVTLSEVSEGGREDGSLAPGRYARLVVADTGPGMDQLTAERVFEPYFTTRARGEGTGLGLASVHGIVVSCGGSVEVTSVPGQGAEFTVLLPVVADGRDEVEPLPTPVSPASGRVLVVDDEPQVLHMLVSMLERIGYDAVGLTNGAEALAEVQGAPATYCLVITDLTMPGMNGVELAEELCVVAPELPVLLCSGIIDDGDELDLSATGIRSRLAKPISMADLSAAMTAALARE